MTCASLGLEPNTVLGHAYIVPFEQEEKVVEATLVIGYRGYLQPQLRPAGRVRRRSTTPTMSSGSIKVPRRCQPGPEQGEKLHAYARGRARERLPDPSSGLGRGSSTRPVFQGFTDLVQYGKTDNPWQTNEGRRWRTKPLSGGWRSGCRGRARSSARAAQVDGRTTPTMSMQPMTTTGDRRGRRRRERSTLRLAKLSRRSETSAGREQARRQMSAAERKEPGSGDGAS